MYLVFLLYAYATMHGQTHIKLPINLLLTEFRKFFEMKSSMFSENLLGYYKSIWTLGNNYKVST